MSLLLLYRYKNIFLTLCFTAMSETLGLFPPSPHLPTTTAVAPPPPPVTREFRGAKVFHSGKLTRTDTLSATVSC